MIRANVNGTTHRVIVEPGRTQLDMLRDDLGLTGTNAGCEHGSCGACTVLVDGQMHPLQQAFWEKQSLQCGFCTPGFLMTAYELLQQNQNPTEEEIRYALSGNICRCTGYQHIVEAVQSAARALHQSIVVTPSSTSD